MAVTSGTVNLVSWSFDDINSSGIAVGISIPNHITDDLPYFWNGSGSLQPLKVTGYNNGRARAINDAGVIAGGVHSPTGCGSGTWRPALWSSASTTVDPTVIDVSVHGLLNDINASSDLVVGWTWGNLSGSYYYRPGKWTKSGGTWSSVTTLDYTGYNGGFAYAVNNNDVIVGSVNSDDLATCDVVELRAAMWNGSGLTVLPLLSGDSFSYAYSINDNDVIVGWSDDDDDYGSPNDVGTHRRAFIYYPGSPGTVYDLNNYIPGASGWTLREARDINNAGWIVGIGRYATGETTFEDRAILLKPIARCVGDLDGDGDVDGADLGILLANWGNTCGPGNIDGEGGVDGADLGLLLAGWSGTDEFPRDCDVEESFGGGEEEYAGNPYLPILLAGLSLEDAEDLIAWLEQTSPSEANAALGEIIESAGW